MRVAHPRHTSKEHTKQRQGAVRLQLFSGGQYLKGDLHGLFTGGHLFGGLYGGNNDVILADYGSWLLHNCYILHCLLGHSARNHEAAIEPALGAVQVSRNGRVSTVRRVDTSRLHLEDGRLLGLTGTIELIDCGLGQNTRTVGTKSETVHRLLSAGVFGVAGRGGLSS